MPRPAAAPAATASTESRVMEETAGSSCADDTADHRAADASAREEGSVIANGSGPPRAENDKELIPLFNMYFILFGRGMKKYLGRRKMLGKG